ncbi:ferritin-like domain-containing protein [Nocardioides sp. YIM 152315]|uniref:Dps family protein n=1 Tax=Nocardioides sp. YIM 152315 TaxID=3031760 RepID=UPI0023DBD0DE|nr:ferritin-like domain-containing protein [Nocardioides sp. YIM 152315]MDF1603222.1 ferritin-like domain-containing protein [Nocardioides sp. YIM 152315]
MRDAGEDRRVGPAQLPGDRPARTLTSEEINVMESMATTSYLPALSEPHERDGVGQELANVLQDLVSLALTGKQLHWMCVGRLAHSLHLQLDELVESWRTLADTVAERAVALGHMVNGQADAVAAGSELTSVAPAAIEDHLVIHEMTRRVASTAERIRGRLRPIGELDPVSQEVLIDVVRELEKQQWLLRVQVRGTG